MPGHARRRLDHSEPLLDRSAGSNSGRLRRSTALQTSQTRGTAFRRLCQSLKDGESFRNVEIWRRSRRGGSGTRDILSLAPFSKLVDTLPASKGLLAITRYGSGKPLSGSTKSKSTHVGAKLCLVFICILSSSSVIMSNRLHISSRCCSHFSGGKRWARGAVCPTKRKGLSCRAEDCDISGTRSAKRIGENWEKGGTYWQLASSKHLQRTIGSRSCVAKPEARG